MNKRMKTVAATAADKLIASADWYTYSGPKRAFDNHHKEFNIDIVKGDKFGILKSGAKFVLLHEDDPSIKFKISEEEIASLTAKAKPFSGKIQGVAVSAKKPELVKPEPVKVVKPVKLIKMAPVVPEEGDTILVDLDGQEETATVVSVIPKKGFEIIPETGQYANVKIRVSIAQILKILKKKPAPAPVNKDEERYVKMSDITGVGYIIEVKQKKYVIVDNTDDNLKKFSPRQLLMPLDPANSTAALKVESMDKLKAHLKERMPYKLFQGHQKAYDKRKKVLEENKAKASKLTDLNVRSGDVLLYNFPKGPSHVEVIEVYPESSEISVKIRGKLKKIPAEDIVSLVKRGSGVTNITM